MDLHHFIYILNPKVVKFNSLQEEACEDQRNRTRCDHKCLQSLSIDLDMMLKKCREASQSSSVQIDVNILERIDMEQHRCKETLQELEKFLDQLRRRIRDVIICQLCSDKVQDLRTRIMKHQ